MTFNPQWLESVPPAGDPDDLADPLARQTFSRAQEELSGLGVPLELNCLYWTLRIADQWEQLAELSSRVPWLDRVAVGFIDPEIDGREAAFGVIFYSNVPGSVDLELPDLRGSGVDAGPFFPAIARVGSRTPQTTITSPSTAVATAWAKSTRTQLGGWLVPGHAVVPGQAVQFSNGAKGPVTETWGDCIDASLVSPVPGPPAGLRRHYAVRGVTAGLSVSVTNLAGRQHAATVMDVDVNLGVVRHALFPIRFSYDWQTSVKGDSGALVTATPCGEPVGMHQGAFQTHPAYGPPGQVAYALCLYQLEDYGGLEVYQ